MFCSHRNIRIHGLVVFLRVTGLTEAFAVGNFSSSSGLAAFERVGAFHAPLDSLPPYEPLDLRR